MVLNLPPEDWKKFTHSQRRKLINKESKRIKRTAKAILREQEENTVSEEELESQVNSKREQANEEAEKQLQHEAWVQRERVAQEELRKKREEQEKKLREREERERLIREEWEALERREKEAEERREKAKMDKNALLQQALSTIDNVMEAESGLELWRNPGDTPAYVTTALAPPSAPPTASANVQEPKNIYGTEKDKLNCPFYIKVGACRFGDRCSRTHPIPSSSSTLMIRGMFSDMSLAGQLPLDEQDEDLSLEVDDQEVYQHYVDFYNDVFPEFEKAGKIQHFKVSCNHEAHLRGNVYVQYSSEEECGKALQSFNGRYYAGRQLSCEYCPILKWRLAVCGMFDQKRCPKGKHCNFLHIFKNPGEESPPRPRSRSRERWNRYHRRGSSRDRDYRSRFRDRRGRSRSRSPRRRRRDRDSYSSDSSPDHRRRRSHRSRERSCTPDRRRSYSPDKRSRRRDRSYSPDRHRGRRDRSYSPSRHRRRRDRSYSPDKHSRGKGRRERSCSPERSRSHHKKRRGHSSEEEEETDRHRKHKKHRKHRHHKHRHSKRESTDESEEKSDTSEEESDEDDAWCR